MSAQELSSTAAEPLRLLLSIEDAAERLSLGRTTFLQLVYARRIESVTIGRRRLIPAEGLEDYVARLRLAAE